MTLPFRRRPDSWPAGHERARIGAAERLDGPLAPDEEVWLDRHLADCTSCRTVAEEYAEDRFAIRALRRDTFEAPRDLWARTAAAIEQDRRRERRTAAGRVPRRSRQVAVPLGALSGVLVVAVVVGASLLSAPPAPTQPAPSVPPVAVNTTPPATAVAPGATPLAVAADVAWLSKDPDGSVQLNQTSVSQVCGDDATDCAPLAAPSPGTIDLPDTPTTVLLSPDDRHIIVVDADADGDASVVLMTVPTPRPSAEPPPSVTPSLPPETPPASPATPVVSASIPVSTPAMSAEPSGDTSAPPAVTQPPDAASPTPTASPEPTPTPPPGAIQIAANMVVVGGTAAFSPDGQRFAFSGRPADGSAGPDVYVWTVGDAAATRITDDHRSVFAGWLGHLVLASRTIDPTDATTDPSPEPSAVPASPAPTEYAPESFLIDPDTGGQAVFADVQVWRPSVDPSGTRAVYWEGTLRRASNGFDWRPATGRLVVGPWPATPLVGSIDGSRTSSSAVDVLEKTAVREWDARWDQTGEHLAVWIADADDPSVGRLSLYAVDPATHELDLKGAPLRKERALPGYALGERRLVWATPPGQDAKGTHVKVLAWTDDGIGQVETAPGDEALIVIR